MNVNLTRAFIIVIAFLGAIVVIPVITSRNEDMARDARVEAGLKGRGEAKYALQAQELGTNYYREKEKYHGNVLKVTGTVAGKNLDQDLPVLYLGTTQIDRRISCQFAGGEASSIALLNRGDTVIVRGVANITWDSVSLQRSVVVQVTRKREY